MEHNTNIRQPAKLSRWVSVITCPHRADAKFRYRQLSAPHSTNGPLRTHERHPPPLAAAVHRGMKGRMEEGSPHRRALRDWAIPVIALFWVAERHNGRSSGVGDRDIVPAARADLRVGAGANRGNEATKIPPAPRGAGGFCVQA